MPAERLTQVSVPKRHCRSSGSCDGCSVAWLEMEDHGLLDPPVRGRVWISDTHLPNMTHFILNVKCGETEDQSGHTDPSSTYPHQCPCLSPLRYESSSEDSSTAENSEHESTENEGPEPPARVLSPADCPQLRPPGAAVAKTSLEGRQLSQEPQHVPAAEVASGPDPEEEIRSVLWVGWHWIG